MVENQNDLALVLDEWTMHHAHAERPIRCHLMAWQRRFRVWTVVDFLSVWATRRPEIAHPRSHFAQRPNPILHILLTKLGL